MSELTVANRPPTNKGRKFPPEPLTPDEVLQLLAAASQRSPTGIRLRALIAVLFGAGLRLQEALDLEPRDVDTVAQTIRVREGKGRKARTVGIDVYACALIDRWLGVRRQLGLTARHRVFATYSKGQFGRPLQQRYVRSALGRLAARTGLTKRIHPHGLRHSLASDMADSGSTVMEIQGQLGHASVATTDRYIHRLRPAELLEHMRQRTWAEPGPAVDDLRHDALAQAVDGLGQVLEVLREVVDVDGRPTPGRPRRNGAAFRGKRYQTAA